MMKRRSQHGSTVALAAGVALASAILIGVATRTLLFSSHQVVYFNAMNRAYRLAETGLTETMGRLIVDPTYYRVDPSKTQNIEVKNNGVLEGRYSVQITTMDTVVEGGYYVVTTATAEVGGKMYATRLHTHFRISNAADYFWACADKLILARGTDASTGKVYAPVLEFKLDSDPPVTINTKVLKAEFKTLVNPPLGSSFYGRLGGADLTPPVLIGVADPNGVYQPTKVSEVVFPQVLDSDMDYYHRLAGNGLHTDCDIQGAAHDDLLNVYPPGYVGDAVSGYPDPYAGKTENNAEHVWYCDGDLTIGNIRVFGQVVFAAKGNVRITGNIISDSNTASTYPGAGSTEVHRGSSTAHQAVIIAQGSSVKIAKTFHPGVLAGELTETIEAMILAPHARFQAENYGTDPNEPGYSQIHTLLTLHLVGSIITAQVDLDSNDSLATVFNHPDGGRVYRYMSSLKTNPPYYLPALGEIYFSYEETVGSPSIY